MYGCVRVCVCVLSACLSGLATLTQLKIVVPECVGSCNYILCCWCNAATISCSTLILQSLGHYTTSCLVNSCALPDSMTSHNLAYVVLTH